MKKIKKVTEKEEQYFCDYCKRKIRPRSCHICGKDVCTDCSIPDPDCDNDYPDWYCNSCWKIGEPHREKISELKENFYTEEEKLIKDWKKKTKEKK